MAIRSYKSNVHGSKRLRNEDNTGLARGAPFPDTRLRHSVWRYHGYSDRRDIRDIWRTADHGIGQYRDAWL